MTKNDRLSIAIWIRQLAQYIRNSRSRCETCAGLVKRLDKKAQELAANGAMAQDTKESE